MRIGVPKEIKTAEYRVGLTPASVRELAGAGHQVMVETGAGAGIDFADQAYIEAGATIAATARAVFEAADLIVKVKEPQAAERAMLRPGQILFTYLHLAADRKQTEDLIASGAACIAYETVTDEGGGLPLLRPMSEVAGRMSIQVGARFLEEPQGGRGILLGGAPGVERGHIVILGGGVAGVNAAQIGMGMHADVSVFDISAERLAQIDAQFDGQVRTLFSTAAAIEEALPLADLVIGAVLVPGAAAPKLVTREMIRRIAQKPWFVPETTALDEQLTAFRTKRKHFACVVDEYGAWLGIVTLEDIIEEIVGEIDDEHDPLEIADIMPYGKSAFRVAGVVTIRDINRQLGWDLPDEHAATVAGLVLHEARVIPDLGAMFEFFGYRFTIAEKKTNQITQIVIEHLADPFDDAQE